MRASSTFAIAALALASLLAGCNRDTSSKTGTSPSPTATTPTPMPPASAASG